MPPFLLSMKKNPCGLQSIPPVKNRIPLRYISKEKAVPKKNLHIKCKKT